MIDILLAIWVFVTCYFIVTQNKRLKELEESNIILKKNNKTLFDSLNKIASIVSEINIQQRVDGLTLDELCVQHNKLVKNSLQFNGIIVPPKDKLN